MSGGSLDYICYTLEEHTKDFDDKELNDLVSDLSQLFHDREWFSQGTREKEPGTKPETPLNESG